MRSHVTPGELQKVKAPLEEVAGILIGNDTLESKGSRERFRGAAEEKLGKAREKVGEPSKDAESIRE